MGRACAEAHGPDPAVESGRSFLLDDRTEGLADPDGLQRAGTEGLHVGLDCVYGEHRHVLDGAGD